MEIHLARIQGFCAGVAGAIKIVTEALEKYGSPLYVYHDIVHNTYVVNDFKKRGVVFVEDLNDVPEESRIIFSAHGVPPAIIQKASNRNLKFIDATCPLVKRVHKEAEKFSNEGKHVILIGHKGHQEVIGTAGYVKESLLHIIQDENDIRALNIPSGAEVAYLTQTTLSVDDTKALVKKLKIKIPNLTGPSKDDICYATQKRQEAVKELARFCDIVVICGSPNSSNSNRLRETGVTEGIPSYLVDNAEVLDVSIFRGKERIGISSGASVPGHLVDEIVKKIQTAYPGTQVHTFFKADDEADCMVLRENTDEIS